MSGGPAGNQVLTSATAAVLTVLLAAEGITILLLGNLLTEHMFIGLVLIGPVVLKLASTGYRFARYYTGARRYRAKGPPPLPMRLLAPLLVLATVGVFASGIALLLIGHRSDTALTLHKLSFIVWGACFAAHFLWHLPQVWRTVGARWSAVRAERVPGTTVRSLLVSASIGGGLVLALALLSLIDSWQRGRFG